MIQIIDTSLTNAFMFFSEPMPIKNPYNNLPFNKSTLYNIYFFIKFNTRLYPELLIKFYNCSFNLTEFKHANEYLLREYSIRNFVYKSSQDDIVDEINDINRFAEVPLSGAFCDLLWSDPMDDAEAAKG